MEQNINLITTLDMPIKSIFSVKLITQTVGGWALLLIIIYMLSYSANIRTHKTLSELELTQKQLKTQVDSLTLELNIFEPTDLLNNLKGLPFSSTNVTGFYLYFMDLAKHTPTNIWIDSFEFAQANNLILLKGYSTSASSIPIFIEALDNSEGFNNKKFGTLQLQKIPESKNISFTLGTVAETK